MDAKSNHGFFVFKTLQPPCHRLNNLYSYMENYKLYMLLLGCKPPGRHTEQHDVFFGIATSINDLVPLIKAYWPEAPAIHIDAWREVTVTDNYKVEIKPRNNDNEADASPVKLFFINLGGYLPNKFEEQHYVLLTVDDSQSTAIKTAKETLFFKNNHFDGAYSHIDDKYGIDIDDIYQIDDILVKEQKEQFQIKLTPAENTVEDEMHLGYLKLSSL